MPAIIGTIGTIVKLNQAVNGNAASNAVYASQIAAGEAAAIAAYNSQLATANNSTLADSLMTNLSLTAAAGVNAASLATLKAAIIQAFEAYPASKGQVMANLSNLLSNLESDATWAPAALAFNNQTAANYSYSVNTSSATAGSPSSTSSFTLTSGADNYNGTSLADTVTATTSGTAASMLLNSSDIIDGKDGSDTLSVTIDGAASGAATIRNIETINVRAATANAFDASGLTDNSTTINLAGSTAAASATAIGSLNTTLKVSNTTQNASFTLADSKLTNSEDTAKLIVDTVTGGTIAIEGVTANASNLETIALTASGGASKSFTLNAGGTANFITKLTIAGDKSVGLTLTDTSYTTINASANTASVDIDARAVTGVTTAITGTVGNDRIVVLNTGTTSADTITGGDGTDTLGVVVANAGTYTHATITKATGFETFELIDNAAVATGTVTAALGGSFSSLITSGGEAGDDTFVFTGGASTTALKITTNAAAVTFGLNANTDADVIDVTLDGTTMSGVITTTNVETVNLTSALDSAGATNSIGGVTAAAASKINLTGSAALVGGTITSAAKATLDFSKYTGDLTATTLGAAVTKYTGGTGKDEITTSAGGLNSTTTFAGGVGADKLTSTGSASQNAGILNLTGFETLVLNADTVLTADFRSATDITSIQVNSAGTFNLNRLDSAATVKVASSNTATNLTLQTGTSHTVETTGNFTTTALGLDAAATTLNLSTASTFTGVVSDINAVGLTTINITGAGASTISAIAGATSVVTVDGSKATGAIVLSTLNGATGAVTVTLGSAADTLTVGSAQADIIRGGGGADTLVGSAGADRYVFEATGAANGIDVFVANIVAGVGGDVLDFRLFKSGMTLHSTTAIEHDATADVNFTDKVILLASVDGGVAATDTAAEVAALIQGAGDALALTAGGKGVVIGGDNSAATGGARIYFVDDTVDGVSGTISTADVVEVGTTTLDIDTLIAANFLFT